MLCTTDVNKFVCLEMCSLMKLSNLVDSKMLLMYYNFITVMYTLCN